jgi:hypothetical protein
MISRYASLRQGLVGAWCPSLGASGYRLIDRSGNNNHGVLTGMDPGTDWVASGSGLALDFDGVNDYVNLGQSTAFQLNFSSRFSISAWIRTTASSGGIIGKRVVAGWYFSIDGSNIIGLNLQGSVSTAIVVNSVASGVCDGNWHQVCCTYTGNSNASGIALFVDGRQVSTTTVLNSATGSLLNAIDTTIGSVTTNQFFIAAQLDDIRLYSRALSLSEIQQLYTGGRGVGLMPERIRHRRKTTAAAFNRRRRILIGASS